MAIADQPLSPSKPDISPDRKWKIPMNTMFLTAAAALILASGAVQAKPVDAEAQAVRLPTTVVAAKHEQTQLAVNPPQNRNPTDLPAYEIRPGGLMINGLLPANGWEG
jgi:hypothetical protein